MTSSVLHISRVAGTSSLAGEVMEGRRQGELLARTGVLAVRHTCFSTLARNAVRSSTPECLSAPLFIIINTLHLATQWRSVWQKRHALRAARRRRGRTVLLQYLYNGGVVEHRPVQQKDHLACGSVANVRRQPPQSTHFEPLTQARSRQGTAHVHSYRTRSERDTQAGHISYCIAGNAGDEVMQ